MKSLLSKEFVRFLLAGGVGFVVTFVLTFLLTEYADWWYGASFVLATAIGWVCIFTLNTYVTFTEAHRGNMLTRFFGFVTTYLGSFVINASVVLLLTEVLGVHYLISIIAGTAVVILINFFVSKHILFAREGTHPLLARLVSLLKEHAAALFLAGAAALIVLIPNALLWREPEFRGVEMMMLDAENHYLARIHEVSEGHLWAANTFLPDKNIPYATPPLGEMIIATFAKLFGMEPARGAVVSKSVSAFIIFLLMYVFAYALARSRVPALLGAATATFGYNLIALSPGPFLDLLHRAPTGGPFIFFSRLVNPSISGIFMFGALLLMYKELFVREERKWWRVVTIGVLIGASMYITPFIYTFLGLILFLSFLWVLFKREYAHVVRAGISGALGLLLSVPFLINYTALAVFPGFEHLSRFLGLVSRREVIVGALLPLMIVATAFVWPKSFEKQGRVFLLIVFAALLLVLNQQLVTGTYLQPGHYHWYITKPLAGILGGLFVGYVLDHFVTIRLRVLACAVILAVLVYNSMGFLSPWYASTRAVALKAQDNAPLVAYLNTLPQGQVVWADGDASDYIPIYTNDDAPNSVNVGSYPIPESFFENRLFLEYRLRGVSPKDFESVIRQESHHVGDRLWGLWLREQFGDPSAVPEEEFSKLSAGYAAFSKLSWKEALDTLGITLIAARISDASVYAKLPGLTEKEKVGDFIIYEPTK